MPATVLWIGESDPSVVDLLHRELPGEVELIVPRFHDPSSAELARADYILNGSGKITGDLLRSAPRLRMVQRLGAGLDGIDVDVAEELGIGIANLPAQNSVAVAEHTILLALAAARHLCTLHNNLRAGRWLPNDQLQQTFELYGKTFGVVGFGNIGREVARRARGFGMDVVYFDTVRAPTDVEQEIGAGYLTLDELMGRVDVLSIHVPLTPQTAGMIGTKQLDALGQGAVLVSISRSGVVDETALVHNLRSGHLAAAGVDVWSSEPVDPEDPLLAAPNVIASPHAGAQTRDTVARSFGVAFANIVRDHRGTRGAAGGQAPVRRLDRLP